MLKKFLSFALCLIMLISVFVPSFSVFAETITMDIPDDAVEYNGHYYKMFDISLTWEKAKEYCENIGGHLVTITSQEEQDFVHELIQSGTKLDYFIGGTNPIGNDILWITGEYSSYSNWNTHTYPYLPEPNDSAGYAEQYIEIIKKHGGWNDTRNAELENNGFVCEWEYVYVDDESKFEGGFNFFMNCESNYLNVGSKVNLHIGYFLNGKLDPSTQDYMYVISDDDVVHFYDAGWSSEYGQKFRITAKKEGVCTVTVTHPVNGESAALEIYVSAQMSAWTFTNIPKMEIEAGKTTNFYNYSGMVVDEFSYKSHMNSENKLDYYTVSMNVYNSLSVYGAVTSYYPDGRICEYQLINRMSEYDSSIVSSFKTLYYSCGDLYHLIKNDKFYSGQSCTNETKVTDLKVPIGGRLSISNNSSTSEIANIANVVNLTCDMINLMNWAEGGIDDKYIINDIKKTAVNKVILGIVSNEVLKNTVLGSCKKIANDSVNNLNVDGDNIIEVLGNIILQVAESTGYNILTEIENELFSLTGIASMGESIGLKILPTGWIIDCMYKFNDGLDVITFMETYRASMDFPCEICIYAPLEDSRYQSNGIIVEGDDEDYSESVIHAYTVKYMGDLQFDESKIIPIPEFIRHQTYNITMYKDGVETQPNSKVRVRIPFPQDANTAPGKWYFNLVNSNMFKVYRHNEDGTLTDMNAWCEGDYIIFETDHFSYYSIVDESTAVLSEDLNFTAASLTLYNDLSLSYKADASLFEDKYQDPYVIFKLGDYEITVSEYSIVDGKYAFDFSDISPERMNDTVYATLYADLDGTTYMGETREYSVAQYCYNMLGKYNTDEYAEFRTLLVDLLNYGAASQVYTGYNADSLVNSSLTDEQASFATADAPELKTVMDKAYATVEEPTVIWKGAGLNLKDSVAMRFKIECDNIEDISIRVTDDSGALWVIHNTLFEETDGGYYVYFEGFNAGQMKDSVYLTAYNGNTPVSDTVRYSIESYAYSKQNSTDEDLNKLLEAMMKYGNSAYSYIN